MPSIDPFHILYLENPNIERKRLPGQAKQDVASSVDDDPRLLQVLATLAKSYEAELIVDG
jgi:hypothetical protein